MVFLIVGTAAILSVGAMPALADNGPHVSTAFSVGNTPTGVNTDRCAGCHRAHTGQSAYLLNSTTETNLCYTCHGETGTGATTNVMDGIQFTSASGSKTVTAPGTGTNTNIAGALRAGGFQFAAIGTGQLSQVYVSGSRGVSTDKTQQVIPPLVASGGGYTLQATTSAHSVDGTLQTTWGNGATGSGTGGAGAQVALTCTSCHDPHGNGNYRILRPIPTGSGAAAGVTIGDSGTKTYTTANYWLVDDPQSANVTVTTPATQGGAVTTYNSSVFLSSISAWCGTCHTRLFNQSNSWQTQTGSTTVAAASQSAATVTASTGKTGTVYAQYGYLTDGSGTAPAVGTPILFTAKSLGGTASGGVLNDGQLNAAPALNGIYWVFAVATDGNAATFQVANLANATTPVQMGTAFAVKYVTGTTSTTNTIGGTVTVVGGNITPDTMFGFRHTSDKGYLDSFTGTATRTVGDTTLTHEGNNNPNCITCHVAHGSNASMAGDASSTTSGAVTFPNGTAGDSFLLRVDNRATCRLCHNL